MLKIINDLKPFFEDNYRKIHVREYAKIQGISPPTASKVLQEYQKEGLLIKEEDKGYFQYSTNRESNLFVELSRAYYRLVFENIGLIKSLEQELLSPIIILFGSLSKAEATLNSDADIAVFTATAKKNINLEEFEKKLKREIHLFVFKIREDVKSPELLNNILNGYKIRGSW